MNITEKHVDAVIVGSGWTGMIMAKELTEAGLKVLVLERGPARDTYPDGAYPKTMDELAFIQRSRLFQDMSKTTVTIRHGPASTGASAPRSCSCAAITNKNTARISSRPT